MHENPVQEEMSYYLFFNIVHCVLIQKIFYSKNLPKKLKILSEQRKICNILPHIYMYVELMNLLKKKCLLIY